MTLTFAAFDPDLDLGDRPVVAATVVGRHPRLAAQRGVR
jgi:hypothetical protein